MNKRGFLKAMAGLAGAVLAGVSFKAKAKPVIKGEIGSYRDVVIQRAAVSTMPWDGKYYVFVSGPSRTSMHEGVTFISTPGPFA